jgi:hypothetical protein
VLWVWQVLHWILILCSIYNTSSTISFISLLTQWHFYGFDFDLLYCWPWYWDCLIGDTNQYKDEQGQVYYIWKNSIKTMLTINTIMNQTQLQFRHEKLRHLLFSCILMIKIWSQFDNHNYAWLMQPHVTMTKKHAHFSIVVDFDMWCTFHLNLDLDGTMYTYCFCNNGNLEI